MKKYNNPISAQLVIPASFAECLTYEKQILWLKKEIDNISGGGDPDVITELQRRVLTLENSYTELQNQINDLPIDVIENAKNTKNSSETVQLNFANVHLPDILITVKKSKPFTSISLNTTTNTVLTSQHRMKVFPISCQN